MMARWVNTGTTTLILPDGNLAEPGDTFAADLPVEMERRWVRARSIRPAPKPKPKPKLEKE
jgi:hypothetical protein